MTCDQQFEALVVRLNKAESENVQLKAQVNKLKDGVTHFNSSRGDLNPLLEAYIKTPEQCLNSVKELAVNAFVKELTSTSEDGALTVNFSILHEYAGKLRGNNG